MSVSVEFMIKQHLESIGSDGLCNPDEDCGCGLDDLAPCDCLNVKECKAARQVKPIPADGEDWKEYPEGYFQVIE